MAERNIAMYNGQLIGIETIYTVINGEQINIPDKLKTLREKSQNNELFCPCGCGANLILVAGDRNLRRQHFREKSGSAKLECKMPTEGNKSIDSKIVLKCWIDDKLKPTDLEARVPIGRIEDIKSKAEFTFLSRKEKFAIRYWNSRVNILDDKLDALNKNEAKIKVIYVVDESNGGVDGQYPEALMKIQNRQQYCLFLSVDGMEYDKAKLKAVFYDRNIDGFWEEIVFFESTLMKVGISENSELEFNDKSFDEAYEEVKKNREKQISREKQKRQQEEKLRIEKERIALKIAEQRAKELEEQRRDHEEELRIRKIEEERLCIEKEKNRKLEIKRQQEEIMKEEENFKRNLEENLEQQETQVIDTNGDRWIKCEICNKISTINDFVSYGGKGHINLGICKECSGSGKARIHRKEKNITEQKRYNPNICPECGGQLIIKTASRGISQGKQFYGCNHYPSCRYTREIRK